MTITDSSARQHVTRYAIGWSLLTFALVLSIASGALAFWVNYESNRDAVRARVERSQALNDYLRRDCSRDERRDVVIVGILQRSIDSPRTSTAYKAFLQAQVDALREIDKSCAEDIPSPITEGN